VLNAEQNLIISVLECTQWCWFWLCSCTRG